MLSYEKKSFGIGSVVAENEQKTCESPESEPPPAGPHRPGGSRAPNMTLCDDLRLSHVFCSFSVTVGPILKVFSSSESIFVEDSNSLGEKTKNVIP